MSEASRESITGPLDLRRDIAGRPPVSRLPGRNSTKADVVVYEIEGRRIAVKDYRPRPPWVRATIGRWAIARETEAYRAAEGVTGLPRFRGRIAPCALALDWIDGRPLASLGVSSLPGTTFDALDRIVAELHARGIAIGDLHHRDVLVGSDGAVHVVDLATAWVLGPRPGAWRRWVFQRLSGSDLVAAARLRARFTGIPEAEALAGLPAAVVRWHTRGRRWKSRWDRWRRRR